MVGRMRAMVGRHRVAAGVVAGCIVAAGAFAFAWFRPDKLFTTTTVNEALPVVSMPAPGASSPGGREVLSSGAFRSLEHPTRGTASIIRLADGSRIVRLEGFRTSNGPDVVVALSATPSTDDSLSAYDDDALLVLAPLKGNEGNQNYTLPSAVDLSRYRSVVIWCRRFRVGFGAAPIA
jgi:Electron transfer DM13